MMLNLLNAIVHELSSNCMLMNMTLNQALRYPTELQRYTAGAEISPIQLYNRVFILHTLSLTCIQFNNSNYNH